MPGMTKPDSAELARETQLAFMALNVLLRRLLGDESRLAPEADICDD